jgi:hemin uptake protein HemP
MNREEMDAIMAQLPAGTKLLRSYRAFEGDIRVIVRHPGEERETRYTIKWVDGKPTPVHMP